MTSHRLSFCNGLIIALLLQGLIHRYGPALFRLAPHRHSDSAFVYVNVVSGQMASQVENQPEHIYRAGECWYETPGAHHLISRNASNTEPAKPLAVLVAVTGDNTLTTYDHAGGSR
jgi:mannose-6-phosphate isomerase-like protein (cupin superfamily)